MTDHIGKTTFSVEFDIQGGLLDDATPTTHATQTQGSVQDRCTLTDAEREAIRVAILEMGTLHSGEFAKADTLRNLLARLT